MLHFGILHDKILKFAVSLWLHFLCGLKIFTVHVHSLSLLKRGLLSSAGNLCKQFAPRSGPTDVGPDLGPNRLTL